MTPSITSEGRRKVKELMAEHAKYIPGTYLSIASPNEIIFEECVGKFDMLDRGEGGREVSWDDVNWFASTSKLLTSVCEFSTS